MRKITYKKTVSIIEDNKSYYVRVRDIADILDIKQPFEFNSFLKKKGKVLSGKTTETFRDKNIDSSRTLFMKLSEIYKIIKTNEKVLIKVAHNYNAGIAAIEKIFDGKDFVL